MEKISKFIHTTTSNKRGMTVALLVISFLCLFGPFAKLSISSSVSLPFANTVLKSDNYSIGTLNLGGFATFQNIGDTKVGDKPLNTYTVLGVNVYDTLKAPPSLGGRLDTVVSMLNPATLDWLRSEELSNQLTALSPDFGATVFSASRFVSDTLTTVRVVTETLQPIVQDVDLALEETASALHTAERIKTIANIVVFSAFAMLAVAAYMFSSPKFSIMIPRILTLVSFLILASIVFMMPIASSQINLLSDHITSQLNTGIHGQILVLIQNLLPDQAALISLFMPTNPNYIDFSIYISMQWGAIIALLSMIAAFTMSFFIDTNTIQVADGNTVVDENHVVDVVTEDLALETITSDDTKSDTVDYQNEADDSNQTTTDTELEQ